jgi:hypothetical protein
LAPVLALVLLLGGCGAQSFEAEPPPAYPTYDGHLTQLFDDSVSPRFMNPGNASDRLFHSRLIEADAVIQARIVTVNAETRDDVATFHLSLEPLSALIGSVPSGPLAVSIPPRHPSYVMIRTGRQRLVGQRAIVIVKNFRGDDTSAASHFRIEPDDATTRSALAVVHL